jgi:hypothetical protein
MCLQELKLSKWNLHTYIQMYIHFSSKFAKIVGTPPTWPPHAPTWHLQDCSKSTGPLLANGFVPKHFDFPIQYAH